MKRITIRRAAVIALFLTVAGLWQAGVLQFRKPTARGNTRVPGQGLIIKGLRPHAIDTTGVQVNASYQKEYRFRTDWFSRHIPVWQACLEGYKGKPDVHYLEIGLYEGRSALWMLENVLTHPTAHLTGVDLFPDEYRYASGKGHKDVFESNLRLSGLEPKTTIIQGYSQVVLRGLPLESFDIIYIDGSHDMADCLEDAVLAWRLLKEGGTLIFDDYLMVTEGDERPDRAIDTFIFFFGKHFETLHAGWQVFLRKKVEPKPAPSP
jgi:SAM-dependent methyltransferase